MGRGWSIAWRVFDAQFWGVPQRRKRIALVADFGGQSAPEILFEQKGLSRDIIKSRETRERTARTADNCSGTAGTGVEHTYCIQGNCIDRADTAGCNGRGWTEGVSYTLNTVDRPAVSAKQLPLADVASTLRSGAGAPKHESDVKGRLVLSEDSSVVYDARGNGDGKVVPTMTGDHQNRVTDYTAVVVTPCAWDGLQVSPTLTDNNAGGNQHMDDKGNFNSIIELDHSVAEKVQGLDGYNAALTGDKAATLGVNCGMSTGRNGVIVQQPYGISSYNSNAMKSDNPNSGIYEADTAKTLDTSGGNPACNQGGIAVVCVDMGGGKSSCNVSNGLSPTITTTHGGTPVIYCTDMQGDKGNANVVTFAQNQRDEVRDLEGVAGSLTAEQGSHQQTYVVQNVVKQAFRKQGHPQNPEQGQGWEQADVGDTLNVFDNSETRTPTLTVQNLGCDLYGGYITGDVLPTVTANTGSSATHTGGTVLSINCKQMGLDIGEDVASTLVGSGYKEQQAVAYGIDRSAFNQGKNALYNPTFEEDLSPTIVARGPNAVCSCTTTWDGQQVIGTLSASNTNGSQRMPDKEHFDAIIDYRQRAYGFYPQMKAECVTFTEDKACCIVNGTNPGFQNGVLTPRSVARRLTPLECERLQGYPDYWTDIGEWVDTNGKTHKESSDSARYKALGNSIALPQWLWLLVRLNRYCKKHTMASLFDGIGGFPLIWETINGLGSCLWASEIEEFPIAVTKHWFDGKTPLPQMTFEVASAEPLAEKEPVYKMTSWDDLFDLDE